jgi:hypothetical protein
MDLRRRHDEKQAFAGGAVRNRLDPDGSSVSSPLQQRAMMMMHHIHKTHQFSLSVGRRMVLLACTLVLAMMLVVLLMMSLSSSLSKQQQQQHELLPFESQQKRQHQSPLVCSHQLLNPPPFLFRQEEVLEDVTENEFYNKRSTTARGNNLPPNDGSLDAMTALWHMGGVMCFDIDVVVLSDGSMVASHPRRLKASILDKRKKDEPDYNDIDKEIVLEEYTLDSLRTALGLRKKNIRIGIGSSSSSSKNENDPFPIFDTEVLPLFAKLVQHNGIPGAFAETRDPSVHPSLSLLPPPKAPWDLRGPLLNIDLKQGPYLTEHRVLKLAHQIHALGLEDFVAVCVTLSTGDERSDAASSSSPADLLEILHRYNTQSSAPRRIPLGLVLRDLVPEDANVDRVRQLVEELYPESIRALIPSFKFSNEWYRRIRDPKRSNTNDNNNQQHKRDSSKKKNELWKLPMTVWTIDSKEDYRYVASITTTTTTTDDDDGDGDVDTKNLSVPMASAVVVNRPMEIIK